MSPSTGQQEALEAASVRAWGARARAWAVSNTRITLIAGGVGFGVAWFLNMWIMAARYDGFRTPAGTPVAGVGNLLQGTIFYLLVSALLSAVITFRLTAGPERFSREMKALPQNIKQAVTGDGDQTAVHLLIGLAGSMVIVLVVGPSTAAALAAGTLLAFTPVLRPVVTGALMRAYMWTMRRVAPRRAVAPPAVAILVGVLGTTGGFVLGWLLPGGASLRVVLGIAAVGGAVVLARRGTGGGGTMAVLAVLLAFSAALLAALLGDVTIAYADDGGFRECGNPGLWQWISACDGSGTVVGQALYGGTAGAAGAAAGSALGATAGGDEAGEGDGSEDDGDGPGGPGGPEDDGTGAGGGGSGTAEEEDEPQGPSGPNPFDLDKIDLEDIDWDLMPPEIKQRIRNQLIHEWRERNPGADYIRQQEAGREIDEMLENDGRVLGWMKDAWQITKDTGAFTWEDFKNGGALMSLIGTAEGMLEGLKTGAIGLKDLVVNAPEMVGVAVDFWTSQNPAASVQQIMDEIPGMTTEMANQFLGLMGEIRDASLAGDNQRVGQLLGKIAGQAEFEVLLGAGTLKAVNIGQDLATGARIGKAVENAEDLMPGVRPRGGGGADLPEGVLDDIRVKAKDVDVHVDPDVLRRREELFELASREGGVKITLEQADELLGLDIRILDNRQGTILQLSEGSADSGMYTIYKLSDDPSSLVAKTLRNDHPDVWTGKWNPVSDKGFKPGEEAFMSAEDLARFQENPLQPGETINYTPRQLSDAEFAELSPAMKDQYLARSKDASSWDNYTGFDSRKTVDYSQPGVKDRYGEMWVAEDPSNPVAKAEFWKDPSDNRVYVRYQLEDGTWSQPLRQASDIDTVAHGGGQNVSYEMSRDLQYKQAMGQLGEGDTPTWGMNMLEPDGAGGYRLKPDADPNMVLKAIDQLNKAEGEMVVTQTLDGLTLTRAEFPELEHLANAARTVDWSPEQAAQLRQWGILP